MDFQGSMEVSSDINSLEIQASRKDLKGKFGSGAESFKDLLKHCRLNWSVCFPLRTRTG